MGVLKHPDTAIHVLQLGLIVKAETTSKPANIKNRTCDIILIMPLCMLLHGDSLTLYDNGNALTKEAGMYNIIKIHNYMHTYAYIYINFTGLREKES